VSELQAEFPAGIKGPHPELINPAVPGHMDQPVKLRPT
jgi:hypothetical protein